MSFFKKLLGGDFDSNSQDGQQLLENEMFGEAKLTFERAISKAKRENQSQVEQLRGKVHVCKVALAKVKIANADRETSNGDVEAAAESLEDARDICDDPEIVDMVEQRFSNLESSDARQLNEEVDEISDEKLLAIIAGTWTEPQAKEYATMPDTLSEALLAIHDEDYKEGSRMLDELINRSDLDEPPKYLWLELGQARLLAKDEEGALEAIDRFIALVDGEQEAISKVISALTEKARALVALKRDDEAKAELIKATELAGKNHGAYLSLGVFLRARGDNEAALKALEKASELMGTMQPDFAVIREMGFTCLAMNRKPEAKAHLAAVIQQLAATGEHDKFDPETAVTLAKLHEESGDLEAAADLFRHLAVGADVSNHLLYNVESARLLKALGRDLGLAKSYLVRATDLADSDEQVAFVDKARISLGL